ncbi:MAG: cupredoxin domain-containing protein [Candidatus Vogelbacteria bacterium]|nr:cupredoxin domain-containing protein [Candidatus Vogelbacteria bacterium]
MKDKKVLMVVAILVVVLVVFFLVRSGSNQLGILTNPVATPESQSTAITPNPEPTTVQSGSKLSPIVVSIRGSNFSPNNISAKKGTMIIWRNEDSQSHSVTSVGGTELSSGTLIPGDVYSHKFNTIGTFKYKCSIHPTMVGTVKITE